MEKALLKRNVQPFVSEARKESFRKTDIIWIEINFRIAYDFIYRNLSFLRGWSPGMNRKCFYSEKHRSSKTVNLFERLGKGLFQKTADGSNTSICEFSSNGQMFLLYN